MAKKMRKGLFIVFDGPEGSGKSTHSRKLYGELMKEGYDALLTSEPGGTAAGALVREILLARDEISLDSASELFLFEADRAQHVRLVLKPALEKGKIVLCDRFNLATFAYQGYGLGVDPALIRKMDFLSTAGLEPDLVIVFDVDARKGLERASSGRRADKMERRPLRFHAKVRRGYLELARKDPKKIKVIRADRAIDDIYGKVKELVYGLIERDKRRGKRR